LTSRKPFFLWLSGGGLLVLLGLIVFGDKGVIDLRYLRQERNRLQSGNQTLVLENYTLYQEKLRLEKPDPILIEHVARRELGFVAPGEWVLMPPASRKSYSPPSKQEPSRGREP
jgi:cell division protein FtsB